MKKPVSPKTLIGDIAFAYFTPTIVQTLGYSIVQTQLHSVPPFAAAFGICLVTAYISDKVQLRYPFIILGYSILIIGLAILMTVHGKGHFSAEYAGICLVCMGAFCAGASIVCWYLMNLQGHVQRAIGSAWMIGFGNTGGIIATFAFLKKDAPFYHAGYSTIMAITVVGVVASVLYGGLIWRERNQAARLSMEDNKTVVVPSLSNHRIGSLHENGEDRGYAAEIARIR
jgi:MFS family permease